jgi:hypothetical protein
LVKSGIAGIFILRIHIERISGSVINVGLNIVEDYQMMIQDQIKILWQVKKLSALDVKC